jgi:hypothetical protein
VAKESKIGLGPHISHLGIGCQDGGPEKLRSNHLDGTPIACLWRCTENWMKKSYQSSRVADE